MEFKLDEGSQLFKGNDGSALLLASLQVLLTSQSSGSFKLEWIVRNFSSRRPFLATRPLGRASDLPWEVRPKDFVGYIES
jgi:hypothetical protein